MIVTVSSRKCWLRAMQIDLNFFLLINDVGGCITPRTWRMGLCYNWPAHLATDR